MTGVGRFLARLRGGKERQIGLESGSLRDSLILLQVHLERAGVECALVGGVALAARGVVRGTRDLDFIVDERYETVVNATMTKLGFEALPPGKSVASYILRGLRVDFLIARRAHGRGMLERAEPVPLTPTVSARVVVVEDLICLKLEALLDSPERGRDRSDIEALLRTNAATIQMEVVREYARALGAERELTEILAAVGR